jgi:hypothetical protein
MSDSASLPPPDYESTDGSPRLILATTAGLVLGLGLTLAASAWVCRSHGLGRPGPRPMASEFFFEHGPIARTGIEQDWQDQDRLVQARLETYGWVDRQAGVVHIPIARAMKQLANEHAAENRGGSR